MRALVFTGSIPHYLAGKVLGRVSPSLYWSGLSCLRLVQVDEPRLPGPDWIKVRTLYAGICGSDLGIVRLEQSPAMSPFTSFPFVMGHEGVGLVEECGPEAGDFSPGDLVAVDPLLTCGPRGISPPCPACARGDFPQCANFTRGRLAPGLLLGGCRDTGGTWSPSFVAHHSQLFRLPPGLDDRTAVLTEPLATALHALLRNPPAAGSRCLVVGAGVIGLLLAYVLRTLASPAQVVVLARHNHQQEWARCWGCEVVRAGRRWPEDMARLLDVRLLPALIGPAVLDGGFDVVYECAGTASGLDAALRCAGPGGRVVLLGLPTFPRGLDWSYVWRKELSVVGSFCYGVEEYQGRRTRAHRLALELLEKDAADLGSLITHCFSLQEFGSAFRVLMDKGRTGALKVLLRPDPAG